MGGVVITETTLTRGPNLGTTTMQLMANSPSPAATTACLWEKSPRIFILGSGSS